MKKIQYILPILLIFSSMLSAQEVAISYEIVPTTANQSSMQLYLQSLTDEAKPIRAVNFSLALPAGCVQVSGQEAIFSEAWTDFLQEVQLTEGLDLNYNNWHYSQRWQYGNADPGLPNTTAILAPAQGESPLPFMLISLEGNCADKAYLEQQAENPINQMGDDQVLPIKWQVIHPKTELELAEGLRVDIFPNPVQDELHVKFVGERQSDYRFELLSMEGKRLMVREMGLDEVNEWSWQLTGLPAAVYVLSVSVLHGDGVQNQQLKIIKK